VICRNSIKRSCLKERMSKRILYVQYTNPGCYPPLEHSSRILANAGWKVLFLGTGALGAADALRFPAHPMIAVKQLPFCPAGFRQKIHYVIFGLWVLASALVWRPRWVYASDAVSCPIALAVSWIPGLRIIYHEHDSPNGIPASRIDRFVMWCRRVVARRAQYCVLPNQRRAERFYGETGSRSNVLCIWNCPRRDEIAAPREPLNGHDVWLLYHGSISPTRFPLHLLNVLASLPDPLKFRVIGYETLGTDGYLDIFRAKARELGISHRVDLVEALPRFELLRYCRQSDIGLALMPMHTQDINMQAMAGASNKAFDYLACGLALLVSELPDWKTTFVEPGYGLACIPDDPSSLERALRSLLDHPAELRAMGERGRQRIENEWNYEMQFARIRATLG
jgi:glycosyltransferase involved in cell wall biosynthesis